MENNDKLEVSQEEHEEQKTQEVEEQVVDKNEEQSDDSTQEVEENDKSSTSKADEESQDDDSDDEDNEFTKALKKVRNEAKNLRVRLKDAQAEIERLKSESNDELVKQRDDLAKQLQDLKLQVRTDKTRSQVVEAARKANGIEPDAIADALMHKVEYDEDDKPTNIDKIIGEYKSTYRRLFTGAVGNGNIGNRDERGSDSEGLTPQDRIRQGIAQRRQNTD